MLVVVAAGDAVVAGGVFSGLVYAELVWMNSVFARKKLQTFRELVHVHLCCYCMYIFSLFLVLYACIHICPLMRTFGLLDMHLAEK
jgi:hypothetical protein